MPSVGDPTGDLPGTNVLLKPNLILVMWYYPVKMLPPRESGTLPLPYQRTPLEAKRTGK